MVVDPPPLREPVLLLRIQLRQPPGVGALRALSDSRRVVRPTVSRAPGGGRVAVAGGPAEGLDRKSTRLNSSHLVISYAVFCLKKKKNEQNISVPRIQRHAVANCSSPEHSTIR